MDAELRAAANEVAEHWKMRPVGHVASTFEIAAEWLARHYLATNPADDAGEENKRGYQPITFEELHGLGKRIDIEIISAPHINGPGGLYEALSVYPGTEWTPLCGPQRVGNLYAIPIVRPRNDAE